MIIFTDVASRTKILGQFFVFVGWLAMTVVAILLVPSKSGHGTHTQLGLPPCGSVVLFHRPCPGCGLTTSITSTLHGQLLFAIKANIFGPILYAIFTVLAIIAIVSWIRKKKMDITTKAMNIFLLVLLAVYVIFGIIRFILVSNYLPN